MPQFRSGAQAIKSAGAGRSKFVPDIRWDEDETKFIQFLTPIEEVVTVLMHPFIWVGEKDDGTKIPDKFISRRDPTLDGPKGYDPLIDRFGETPINRTIGLGVELDPVYKKGSRKSIEGFNVQTRQFENRQGETKEVPAVGLIIQSPAIFYGHLATISDVTPIEEVVFAVKRTGKSTNTQYTFMNVGEAIDLDGDVDDFLEEFDFTAYLEELASEEKMRTLIDPLEDDWVVNNFSKNKGATKKASVSKPRRRKVEDESEDGESEEPTGDDESPTAKKQTRTRRFAQLRQETQERQEMNAK